MQASHHDIVQSPPLVEARQRSGPTTWAARDLLVTSGCIALLVVLLGVNLVAWPSPWFDEGLNLSTAATLADDRTYGLPDSEGIRVMDPAIQTGPPVIIPVAVAFDLFGYGLLQARLVMVAFALVAAVAYLLLAHRIAGVTGVAVSALFLAIGTGDTFTSYIPLGRQVLGEIPALGFICIGMLILYRHMSDPDSGTAATAVGAGLLFGLAMVTKSQVLLTLPVAIGLWGVLNIVHYRLVARWLPFATAAIAVGIVGCWYATQIMIAGIDGFQENREVLREGFGIHIAQFSLGGVESALRVIASSGYLFWGVPGLIYAAYLATRRNRDGALLALLVLFVGVWLTWYVSVSIGWSRYAAMPFLLTPLFTARLVADTLRGLRQPDAKTRQQLAMMAGVALVAIGTLVVLARTDTGAAMSSPERDHEQMATYLQDNVSASSVIETWAWELDAFVDHRLHHPTTPVTNAYTLVLWDGRPLPPDTYDPGQAQPDFVLENAFSEWTGIYADFVRVNGTLVAEYGEYRLYRVE